MSSTYTANTGIEKIGSGEQAGTWGTTTNTNFDIIDDALNGVISITVSGETTLTTSDGTVSNGHHKVILLEDNIGSAFDVIIAPNDVQKWYFIKNNTDQTATIKQGTGGTVGNSRAVELAAGTSGIIFADGGGTGAIVGNVSTDLIGDSSPQLGGNLDTNSKNINFGDSATAGTDDTLQFGASQDLKIYHHATNGSFIVDSGTGALNLAGSQINLLGGADGGETMATFADDGAATLFHDNSSKLATSSSGITVTGGIANSSGDMTIDVDGDLTLDANGGDILFKDDGTTIATLSNTSSDFVITTGVQDKDFIVKGDDGGLGITALTIDMSAAGAATFNNDVTAFSDRRLKTDIKPETNALPKVMQMQGVYYKRNDVEDAREQVGVIAQDMEAIVPEVVLTADDEMQTKSVDYGKLCAVLIESIKELKAEIDELKKS